VIICPRGELLTDGRKQENLGLYLSDTEVGTLYTWRERLLPVRNAFTTLRFLDGPIVPTRVEVYCLALPDLRVQKPRNIKLFSSNTNSIYPETENRAVDSSVLVNSGMTVVNTTSSTFSYYEYQKYTLAIPEDEQTSLQYL